MKLVLREINFGESKEETAKLAGVYLKSKGLLKPLGDTELKYSHSKWTNQKNVEPNLGLSLARSPVFPVFTNCFLDSLKLVKRQLVWFIRSVWGWVE